mgnify:CR=1 FL=1
MDYRIDKYVTPQWLFDQHLKSDSIHEYGIGVAIRHAIIKRYADGHYDEAKDLYKRYKSYRDFDRYVGLYIDIRDNGFDKTRPVLIYAIRNIISNGSHRVACSVVLNISVIPMRYRYHRDTGDGTAHLTGRSDANYILIKTLPDRLKNHKKGYTSNQVDLILDSLNTLTSLST